MNTLKYFFIILFSTAISTFYAAESLVSTFENGITTGTVFVDEWEESPFNTNQCINTTVEVIDNPYLSEMNSTEKVLHYVRPYYAGDRNGVEIKLENTFTLSTTTKYLHVLVYKPTTSQLVLAAIDRTNNVQQVIVKSESLPRANAWSDIVFELKGNAYEIDRIRIYPDCESSVNRLDGDIDIYIDEIVYSDSAAPRTATGYCRPVGTLSAQRYLSFIKTSGALLNTSQVLSKATTINNKAQTSVIVEPGSSVNLMFTQKSTETNNAWVADVYTDFDGDYEFVSLGEYVGRITGTTSGDSIIYNATVSIPASATVGGGCIRIKMTDAFDPAIAGNNHESCAEVQDGVVCDIAMDIQPVNARPVVKVEGLAEQGSWGSVGINSIEGTEVKVTQGTSITVSATPAAGYSFLAWRNKETMSVISTDANFTFRVQTNITLVAVFSKVEYCQPEGITPIAYFLGKASITPIGKSTLYYIGDVSTEVDEMTSNYAEKSVLGGVIVKRGSTFTLALQKATSSSSFTNTNIGIWADWNSNHIFEAEEFITSETGADNKSFTISVPTTALKGNINVRVRIHNGTITANDACKAIADGSTYDFEVTVAPNDDERFSVTAQPSIAGAATFTLSPAPGVDGKYAAGTNVDITAVPATGYSFVQWKKDGVPYGATMTSNNPLPITALTEDLNLTMAVEAQFPTYCAGTAPNNGDGDHYGIQSGSLLVNGIEAFTFTKDQTISDFSSSCVAEVCPGDTLTLTIDGGEHLKWAQGIAYIDWNMDGTWNTTSEAYELFNNNITTVGKTTTIIVPTTITAGPRGMRLCSGEAPAYNSLGGGPCQARRRGTLQTFKINVSEPPISSLTPQVIVSCDGTRGTVSIVGVDEKIYDAYEGEMVTVEAVAFPDYEFREWVSNGVSVSTSPSYTFEVTGKHNLVAVFASESLTYCTGTGTNRTEFRLSSVSITAPSSSVSVASTTQSINDYQDSKIVQARNGETLTITFSALANNTKWGNVVIYVDWNRDGVFSADGEKYDVFGGVDGTLDSGHQYSNENYSIVIPMSALAGLSAIRIISEEALKHNVANNFDPCGTRQKGSVHTFGLRIVDPTVGCEIPVTDANILCYPNPMESTLHVNATIRSRIRLSGIDGVVVAETVAVRDLTTLQIEGLSAGIYLLQVISVDGRINTQKLIKQ